MKKTIVFLFVLCLLVISGKSFSQVDTSWIKKYSGAQNMDQPRAIILDASNNVYVTGKSLSASNGNDIVTIKYNSSGVAQWTAVYNGSGNSTDEGTSIILDGTSNLYVTGVTTRSPFTGLDYITLKYNVTTGAVTWASVYNGAGNMDDYATRLTVKNNSVYVTGKGFYRDATNSDFVTIKYNGTTGDSTWVRAYNGSGNANDSATFVRVSADTSIFVTGKSFGTGNNDIATVKYNATGTQNWAKRVNGTANGEDFGVSLSFNTTTSAPDIYVAGVSQSTGTGADAILIKYSNAGVETWLRRYNGSANGDDNTNALLYKNDNEIYLTGKAQNTGSGADIVMLKFDNAGVALDTVLFNGSANGNDEGFAITSDASGYLYLAGRSAETGTGNDGIVIKYTITGIIEWSYKYNSSGSGSDAFAGVVVDASTSRNVYITGTALGGASGTNYVTIKLVQDRVLDLNVWIQGFYKPATNSMVRDTVRVKLYNSSATTIIDSGKIYLDTLGKGRLYFKTAVNATGYYVVIKHRNLIETWGASTSIFTNLYLTYDFTNAVTKAYGSNLKQVDASPVEFAAYNGDSNQDGSVDAADLVDIFNDGNNFVSGYVKTDLNGDDFVDVVDLVIGFNNANDFVSLVRP